MFPIIVNFWIGVMPPPVFVNNFVTVVNQPIIMSNVDPRFFHLFGAMTMALTRMAERALPAPQFDLNQQSPRKHYGFMAPAAVASTD